MVFKLAPEMPELTDRSTLADTGWGDEDGIEVRVEGRVVLDRKFLPTFAT